MRSIMINKQNDPHQALYHEIIEHEGRKFRIIMDIHNGSAKRSSITSKKSTHEYPIIRLHGPDM